MFLRILIWLALLLAAWWFLRTRSKAPPIRTDAAAPPAIAPAEVIVDCAHCGLHLPASEALRDDAGRAYCCRDHRSSGPRGDR